jgi:hypothetical protein
LGVRLTPEIVLQNIIVSFSTFLHLVLADLRNLVFVTKPQTQSHAQFTRPQVSSDQPDISLHAPSIFPERGEALRRGGKSPNHHSGRESAR